VNSWRSTYQVLNQRVGVENTMRVIAGDCRLELDIESTPELDQNHLEHYTRRALDALRADRFASLDRRRELERFLDDPDTAHARERFEQLEQLLRDNIYEGLYLRP
jgi:hypothetical protein